MHNRRLTPKLAAPQWPMTLPPGRWTALDYPGRIPTLTDSRKEPTIFVWFGVIFYLTPSAARSTLEYIAW